MPITQKVGSPPILVQDELCRVLNGLCSPAQKEYGAFLLLLHSGPCVKKRKAIPLSQLLVLTTEHEAHAGAAVEIRHAHTSYS